MKKILFTICGIIGFVPVIVLAQSFPSFPMSFWGNVTVNSVVAPAGTIIRAYSNDVLIGQVTTLESGIYGYTEIFKQKLTVASVTSSIIFTFQNPTLNEGVETKGTSEQKQDLFISGETVNKNLAFNYNIPAPPVPPTPTGGGGGSGSIPAFIEPSSGLKIDYEIMSSTGTAVVVKLIFNADRAVQMAVSNDAYLAGATKETYQVNKIWTLTAGALPKNVYVMFFDSNGAPSRVVSQLIIPKNETIVNNKIEEKIISPVKPENNGQVLGVKVTRLDELLAKLKQGNSGKEVIELQTELKRLGFFTKTYKITNYYGTNTVAAVKKYRADQAKKKAVAGVKIVVNTTLIDSLIAKTKFGQSNTNVKSLQTELKKAGYYPSNLLATGYYGATTKASVSKYLSSKNK